MANAIYKHEHCRLVKKLIKLLNAYSADGYILKSVSMGDLMTRYELLFEKDLDAPANVTYEHKCCRRSKKLNSILEEYSRNGWKAAFQFMSDMGSRYDVIFVKDKVSN